MAYPVRYNPNVVKIRRLVLTAPTLDPDFGEPRGGMSKQYTDPYTLQAQVRYQKRNARELGQAGDSDATQGHLTFTLRFLKASGLDPLGSGDKLKKGDLITEIAGVVTDFKITEVRPQGHLRATPNLWFYFFEKNEDEKPRVR